LHLLIETEWTWDESMNCENTGLSKSNLEVMFHKHFSNGTAAIRGSTPLREGQHYWEIKMTTGVYGTDMVRHSPTLMTERIYYSLYKKW